VLATDGVSEEVGGSLLLAMPASGDALACEADTEGEGSLSLVNLGVSVGERMTVCVDDAETPREGEPVASAVPLAVALGGAPEALAETSVDNEAVAVGEDVALSVGDSEGDSVDESLVPADLVAVGVCDCVRAAESVSE
jgi:hypothetical protein